MPTNQQIQALALYGRPCIANESGIGSPVGRFEKWPKLVLVHGKPIMRTTSSKPRSKRQP